jgi:YidC/Oxa1 family membrane protein insertase
MDTKRLILFVLLSFSVLLLWDSWQKKNIETQPQQQNDLSVPSPSVKNKNNDFQKTLKPISTDVVQKSQLIKVETDLYSIDISSVGGDIRNLSLKNYLADDSEGYFQLMSDSQNPLLYIAQTGLLGENLPTHKSVFTSTRNNFQMSSDTLVVPFTYEADGLVVRKIYTFTKNSYLIKVSYDIKNNSDNSLKMSAYYQLIHDGESNQGSSMMPKYTGTAYYTDDLNFNKLSFDDVDSKSFSISANDGWIGIIQQYFASSWIVRDDKRRELYSKKIANNIYASGLVISLDELMAGEGVVFDSNLYAGPQAKSDLEQAAKGMPYTVDYGWLTFIASPLFSVMSGIQKMVINWGLSIILLTVLIKLLFYPLSAASYRSMGQMRELSPRLQSMKEKFGDDKQKMQQAMMELYKTEKINPLGGCLPILIQIPVFIALYWVLLGSVELRNASFLYITDLSSKDPYYVLPLLMAASMFLQTKLNPKPTDPMQARLMMMMPIVFSIFFFFFPSGLVLYWLVNNILSITQQWYVNKKIHAEALKKKGHA